MPLATSTIDITEEELPELRRLAKEQGASIASSSPTSTGYTVVLAWRQ